MCPVDKEALGVQKKEQTTLAAGQGKCHRSVPRQQSLKDVWDLGKWRRACQRELQRRKKTGKRLHAWPSQGVWGAHVVGGVGGEAGGTPSLAEDPEHC